MDRRAFLKTAMAAVIAAGTGAGIVGALTKTTDDTKLWSIIQGTDMASGDMRHVFTAIQTSVRRVCAMSPNDANTWKKAQLIAQAHLEDACRNNLCHKYIVKCDEETNPPMDRENYLMSILIGVQPNLSSEFEMVTLQFGPGTLPANPE